MYLTLFGTPSGFSARTYGRPQFELNDRWIDSRSEVPLDDGEWAVMVSRRQCTQGLLTWIGLYRPAHEIHVSRGGQYGAGLWLLNQAAPGPEAFALLTAVADEVARLALVNGKFTRSFEAFEAEIRWPDALGTAVRKALRPATLGGVGVGDKPMLLMDASAPDDTAACGVLVDLAQGGAAMGGYQRMVITDRPRVVRQIVGVTHAIATTPARWQQGVEATVDASARRAQAELQAALADAQSARKEMATLGEQLLADHDRAMAQQTARLTAEFNQQLQQANSRIAQLEPDLAKALGDLEAISRDLRAASDTNVLLKLVVQDLQADASVGFEAAHALKLERQAERVQALKDRNAAMVIDLAGRDQRLAVLDQGNQALQREVDAQQQQIRSDAARHDQALHDLQHVLDTRTAVLQAEVQKAQAELGSAKAEVQSLRQEGEVLRRQLPVLEPGSNSFAPSPEPTTALAPPEDSSRAPRRRSAQTTSQAFKLSPMVLAMAVALLIVVVSVVWGLFRDKTVPQADGSAKAASQTAAAPEPDCAAAWQTGVVTTSPTIIAPSNLHPASIADAVWAAACNARRAPACRNHDQREITRHLDGSIPLPGANRWTLKVALPQGCQLAADSIWEWSAGALMAQRAYLSAAEKKDPAAIAPAKERQDKPDKAHKKSGNAANSDATKAGTPNPEQKRSGAPASSSGQGNPAGGGHPPAGGNPTASAPRAETKPPSVEKAVTAPGAGGGAGDGAP